MLNVKIRITNVVYSNQNAYPMLAKPFGQLICSKQYGALKYGVKSVFSLFSFHQRFSGSLKHHKCDTGKANKFSASHIFCGY